MPALYLYEYACMKLCRYGSTKLCKHMCMYEGARESWMCRRPKNCLNTPPVAQKARSIVTSARDTPRDKMRSKCDQDAIKMRSRNYYDCWYSLLCKTPAGVWNRQNRITPKIEPRGRRVEPLEPLHCKKKKLSPPIPLFYKTLTQIPHPKS